MKTKDQKLEEMQMIFHDMAIQLKQSALDGRDLMSTRTAGALCRALEMLVERLRSE